MLIILEGPDGSGKTTLGRKLEMDLGFKFHESYKPKSPQDMLEYYDQLADLANDDKIHITDRCGWISGTVYSRAFPNHSVPFPLDEYEDALALPQIVIYCTGEGDISEEKKAWKNPEFLERVKADREKIWSLYELVLGNGLMEIPTYTYDFFGQNQYDKIKRIILKCADS